MRTTRRQFLLAAGGVAAVTGFVRRAWADDLTPGTWPLRLDPSRDGVLHVPPGYRASTPMPLIVMFHGAGGSGQSCQYAFPHADEFGYLVLAPDSRDERTWDIILGEFGPDGEFLQAAFRQVLARANVDRRRLVIAGHSDGGSYALSFGIGVGDTFGQILAMSPGIMTPFAATGKPRVFISHGIHDNVMPIDETSRTFVPRLRHLSYDVTYREYDGRHSVPSAIVREGFQWLR